MSLYWTEWRERGYGLRETLVSDIAAAGAQSTVETTKYFTVLQYKSHALFCRSYDVSKMPTCVRKSTCPADILSMVGTYKYPR
jgi:hypothetical protein